MEPLLVLNRFRVENVLPPPPPPSSCSRRKEGRKEGPHLFLPTRVQRVSFSLKRFSWLENPRLTSRLFHPSPPPFPRTRLVVPWPKFLMRRFPFLFPLFACYLLIAPSGGRSSEACLEWERKSISFVRRSFTRCIPYWGSRAFFTCRALPLLDVFQTKTETTLFFLRLGWSVETNSIFRSNKKGGINNRDAGIMVILIRFVRDK